MVPTSFGQSVLDHVQRMQDEASAINRSSASLEDSLAGVVRISATEGIGTAWLPPVLQAFRQTHPDMHFDIGIGFREFNLAQREADIALRWQSPGDQNSLVAKKVADVSFGLFASPNYLQKKGVPQSLDELKDHDAVIAMVKDEHPLWMTDDNDEPVHMPENVPFRTNNFWAFKNAIGAGYGIGVLPLCAGSLLEGSSLVRVLPNFGQLESLYLVAHEDVRRSARIRAVFDFIGDAMKKDAAFFLNGGESIFESSTQMHCGTSGEDDPNHQHKLISN